MAVVDELVNGIAEDVEVVRNVEVAAVRNWRMAAVGIEAHSRVGNCRRCEEVGPGDGSRDMVLCKAVGVASVEKKVGNGWLLPAAEGTHLAPD